MSESSDAKHSSRRVETIGGRLLQAVVVRPNP